MGSLNCSLCKMQYPGGFTGVPITRALIGAKFKKLMSQECKRHGARERMILYATDKENPTVERPKPSSHTRVEP